VFNVKKCRQIAALMALNYLFFALIFRNRNKKVVLAIFVKFNRQIADKQKVKLFKFASVANPPFVRKSSCSKP
jgi:hypothetical protein